jgi:hypothetical protein
LLFKGWNLPKFEEFLSARVKSNRKFGFALRRAFFEDSGEFQGVF